MRVKSIAVLALALLVFSPSACAKRVLFYEIGTQGSYTIEKDYQEFAGEFEEYGYDVASLTKSRLTKQTLEHYDVLVLQNVGGSLETEEISAIIWFVLNKGKSLFINGGADGKTNQITIPFGVTIDEGTLIDTTNQIGSDRTDIRLHEFDSHAGMGTLIGGLNEVSYREGRGFRLSAEAKPIITGDEDTYSDTGSFPSGSRPPVAAANLFGNGLVFIYGDASTLSDKFIDQYSNRQFAVNVIEWLDIASMDLPVENSSQALQVQIGALKIKKERLNQEVERINSEIKSINQQNSVLENELYNSVTELNTIKEGMVGPLNRDNWAIVVFGLGILSSAIVVARARTSSGVDEDFDDLDYDLEDEEDELEGIEI